MSKDDIMDAVWPGLIVEENRLQVHVATLRKALGTSRDLIKTVPGRGYLLVACASPGRNRCPRPTRRPPSRLPYRPMPTRRRCLRRSSDATPKSRRSSRCSNARRSSRSSARAGSARRASPYAWPTRCAAARASACCSWSWRAGTRADMLIAVAAELGLDTQRVPAIEDIGAAFAASRYLLVFDNAEHIVDLVANLVETLTSCAGSLRVLVTSREPLHISAEAVLRMAARGARRRRAQRRDRALFRRRAVPGTGSHGRAGLSGRRSRHAADRRYLPAARRAAARDRTGRGARRDAQPRSSRRGWTTG